MPVITRSRKRKRVAPTARRVPMRRLRRRIPRRSVPLALKPHTFCERKVEEVALPVNGGGVFMSFQLADIYNSTSYQKLFEYYIINKVVVTFAYKADGNPRRDITQANQTAAPNEANPLLWFKVDHNDITADTLDTMKASTRTRRFQFTNNKPHFSIQIKPAVLDEVYKSTVASTYIPKWKQLLSMGDPSVPHYGLKCYATGPAAAQYGQVLVTVKYYFTCKNNE